MPKYAYLALLALVFSCGRSRDGGGGVYEPGWSSAEGKKPQGPLGDVTTTSRAYGGGIGSDCDESHSCAAPASGCLSAYPGGMCSAACGATCSGASACLSNDADTAALCIPKCDRIAFAPTGCREGYHCVEKKTVSDAAHPAVATEVCLPDTALSLSCSQQYVALGGLVSSAAKPPTGSCTIADALLVPSSFASLPFVLEGSTADEPLYLSCAMITRLRHISEFLAAAEVEGIRFAKIYYKRGFACAPGNDDIMPSHRLGNGIDITGFLSSEGAAVTYKNAASNGHTAALKAFEDILTVAGIFDNGFPASANEDFASEPEHYHAEID